MDGLRAMPVRSLGFSWAAMKPDKPARNGSRSTIFPFGLKAEFLARQNRRPPPSSAQRFGPLVPRGCWPGSPDFL